MTKEHLGITPVTLKEWLHDGKEIAVIDVREYGQYGEQHLFYVVSIPYSKLEHEMRRLVPRKTVRIVLIGDDTNTLTQKAIARLSAIGYSDMCWLDGGMPAWQRAGFEVFAGVNLPSKAFGELAEHAFNTPRISATALSKKILAKEDIVILDGRPFSEFQKMSIPTAICCPNGELPLRIDDLVKNTETTIIINCAGRTRSIIGAQTLINLGIQNPVLALENGTQGWYLEDLVLDHGKTKRHSLEINTNALHTRKQKARDLANKHGVSFVEANLVEQWLKDPQQTTYLCDVRTSEEYASGTVPGAQHTPGGQLVQATDQYIGVKGSRIVLFDNEGVRAPAMASWLAMLGWNVSVCENAMTHNWASQTKAQSQPLETKNTKYPRLESIQASQIEKIIKTGAILIDLRSSMKYRESHINSAIWSIRPQLSALTLAQKAKVVVLLVEEPAIGKMASKELMEMGVAEILINTETPEQWQKAGLILESTPDLPPDHACIDYLFFVHDRHDGNKAAARQYLAWEMNLLAQIDDKERASFRLPH